MLAFLCKNLDYKPQSINPQNYYFYIRNNFFFKSTKLNIISFVFPLSLHCTAKVLEATRIMIKYQRCVKTNSCVFNCKLDNKNGNPENL